MTVPTTGPTTGPTVTVNGRAVRRRRRRAARHRARLAARPGVHRRQGGLRRGRVRRVLGAGRPARSCGRPERHPLDRAERLPGAGARARRPGGRHRRGPRHARTPCTRCSGRWPCAAGRSAATARRASCAAWPPSSTGRTGGARPVDQRPRRRPRARPERLRPARAQREPVPLHRVPADPRRRVRARRPARTTTLRRAGAASPPPAVVPTRVAAGDAEFVRPADLADGAGAAGRPARRHGDRRLHRLGRRGQPPRHPRPVRRRRRPVARAAHVLRRGHDASRSVPRSPSPRSSGCSTAGCRCWTSCSRSSPPG